MTSLQRSILFGSIGSTTLWIFDLLQIGQLRFAGTTDSSASQRLLEATVGAVYSLEFRLLCLHVFLGALLGFLIGTATSSKSNMKSGAIAFIGVIWIMLLLCVSTVIRYPQLFADRLSGDDGTPSALLKMFTHSLGPYPFEVILAVTMLIIVGLGIKNSGRAKRMCIVLSSLILCLIWFYSSSAVTESSTTQEKRPNVLILAIDSLRSDRITNSEVMPFVSRFAKKGSLYTSAFVPIARTFPSWVSTLTGSEIRNTRVRNMFPSHQDRGNIPETIFHALGDENFQTFLVSDFAGDIFPRFQTGIEAVDAPSLTADRLAASTVLSGHMFSLFVLRSSWLRSFFDIWQNLPSISDPRWLIKRTTRLINESKSRPFAGLVFFGTAHFPYVAPYPHYLNEKGDYTGRFLYQVPPLAAGSELSDEDKSQIEFLYDASLSAVDQAIEQLLTSLEESGHLANTLVVITSDHGEDLGETRGIAGHGDILGFEHSQRVPILLSGPEIQSEQLVNQVRLLDLPATILDYLNLRPSPVQFGDGISLFEKEVRRPLCVETGLWFFPDSPAGLANRRLQYPGIADLLELVPDTREMILKPHKKAEVEAAKFRGLINGNRSFVISPTREGLQTSVEPLKGVSMREGAEALTTEELESEFWTRCVENDPQLSGFFGSVRYSSKTGVHK